MLKLAIGAGHGINTPGKRVPKELDDNQTREWVLNDRVVRFTIAFLKHYNVDILRTDDPTGKVDVDLRTRANKANNWKADLYLSIHHNAGINLGQGGGTVVFRYPNSTKTSKALTKSLYDEVVKQTGLKGNRANPVSENNFQILRQTNMTALLLENGFMDSRTDYPIIITEEHARKTAIGIVNFLIKNYKIKKNNNSTDLLYRVIVDGNQVGAYSVLANINKQIDKAYKDRADKVVIEKVRG